ncbi:MAG: hypothetical protein Marn2KO_36860 [Marinobacter nauticus]
MADDHSNPKGSARHYTPKVQNHIGKRIDEIIREYKGRTGKQLQKTYVVEEINARAGGHAGFVDPYMFSRLRKRGTVADEHVAKFIEYFSQPEFEPGFRDEVAQIRRRLVEGKEQLQPGTQLTDLSRFDDRAEFYVYEVAFLWHDQEPPPVSVHTLVMSREVQETKQMLHSCIEAGKLSALEEVKVQGGVSRSISRQELTRFAQAVSMRPRFLFPESSQSRQDLERGCQTLIKELQQTAARQLSRVTDWSAHNTRDVWPISEVAFLWHGFEPPSMAAHWLLMTDEIKKTKQMLHDSVDAGQLQTAREVQTLTGGVTRFLQRQELKSYAISMGENPEFLFNDT